MLKTNQGIGHVTRHGEGNTAIGMYGGIVPFKSEAKIKVAFPVGFHGISIVKNLFQMESVVFVDVFNTKVVDAQGEADLASGMSVEAVGESAGMIVRSRENLFELFVSQTA